MAGLLDRQGLLWWGSRWWLGMLVDHDGVVEVVVLKVVLEGIGIVLGRRCSLRLAQLLGLGELDGVVLELLQHRVVQVVEAVVREVIHGRSLLRLTSDMAMPLAVVRARQDVRIQRM
jgi:hypothetical protein